MQGVAEGSCTRAVRTTDTSQALSFFTGIEAYTVCRYHSVRIDPVHYCDREAFLAERRKKSRFDRNGIPEDPAQARLRLFRRTVRDDPTRLGKMVQFLKIPYMLRESSHVELAQTIAVLPNLHYVDLPEGMFADEPSLATLRLEVQARCPNIRKTAYNAGSEQSLAQLASGRIWTKLEVLELNGINIDPMTMRAVLSSLTNLRALKVTESQSFSDEVLICDDGMPSLPPLEELVLKDTPRVTITGLVDYLAWQETQNALRVLTLKDTGVHPSSAADILIMASSLHTLALQSRVVDAFPHQNGIRPLASKTLTTLRYEVSGESTHGSFSALETGYYNYLTSSILGGGFPRLRRLYVLDDSMPEKLQGLPPPNAAFSAGRARASSFTASRDRPSVPSMRLSPDALGPPPTLSPPQRRPISNVPPTNRFSSNNPFAQSSQPFSPPPALHTLEVFTKSDELGKWNFSRVDSMHHLAAPAPPALSPNGRPVSSYGLGADVQGMGWGGNEARRSVMVGSGVGAFLAVPAAEENPFGGPGGGGSSDSWRPKSSGGASVRSNRDLWR